ncbi:MAG: hypothetical protein IT244_01830 [Bacteroidia bacterium]|nr:hypothetical protein [Bacteroidia bacterium]
MNRIVIIVALFGMLLPSCRNDKYATNRFSGIYEITKYTRELWDSTGKVSTTEIPCKYVFYIGTLCKIDTSGQEPSFLTPLNLENFTGLDRFTMEWGLGTSDNYRLSLMKLAVDGITTNSVILNVKRGIAGQVNAFTYFIRNSDGSYYFEEYKVKVTR